jgi:GntR family transcriptional regulator
MTSTSSPIRRLDPADPTALHEQAAAQIRRAIAEGQAAPGERLPPAGDLAAVLGVNRNTVLRALRLLREEGVIEFRRGRGITVTAAAPQAAAVLAAARDLLALARRHGYQREDLVRLIETLPDP